MLLCIVENMNPNYSIIPCFVEKKSKMTFKMCTISKQSLWFSTTNTYSSSYFFPKLCVSSFLLILQNFHLLNYPKSHHHDQNNKNSKVPWLVSILIALFIQNHILILPPKHSTPSSYRRSKIECGFGPIDAQLLRVGSLFAFSWVHQYCNLPQSFVYNL